MDLWKNYGIISYNLGGGNETIPGNYYKMLLALEQTRPKIIVLDAYLIGRDIKLIPEKKYFITILWTLFLYHIQSVLL